MNNFVRIDTNQRMSRAIVHDGRVFLSGMTADDRTADVKGQTEQVLAKIDRYLNRAGTDKAHLLTAQIWLKDIQRDFDGMNEIWNSWTAPNAAPTRATAQCLMASPEILIEIIVTAAIPY